MTVAQMVGRNRFAATFLTILVVLVVPSLARPSCRQDCRREHRALIQNLCDTIKCFHDEQQCRAVARDRLTTCVEDKCSSHPKAGHCKLLRACVEKCQSQQEGLLASCPRHCPAGRDCRALLGGLRDRCVQDCRQATPTAGTSLRARSARPASSAKVICEGTCVAGDVADCFDDCRDSCDGNQLAEPICFQACCDAHCK